MSVKRSKVIDGSLRSPLLRFVTGVHLTFNPHILRESQHFHDRMFELATKFDRRKIQESYIFQHKIIKERDLTIKNHCKLTYVDDTLIEFDFTNVPFTDFIVYLKEYNEIVESKRNIQGFDDEFEDED